MELPPSAAPLLKLGAYHGPLDLLLDLARAQRVDLAVVSIADLADQFAAAVEARGADLGQRADWLVMAAWLVLLKSRLLLPAENAAAQAAAHEADRLRERLVLLEHVARSVAWLEARPVLGRDVFVRPAPEHAHGGAGGRAGDAVALLEACLAVLRIGEREAERRARPPPPPPWRVADAAARIADLLPGVPDGAALERFLPPPPAPDAPDAERRRRGALASTLLAGLELAREGRVELRQDASFGTIEVHPAKPDGAE